MNDFIITNVLPFLGPDMIVKGLLIYFFIVWFCVVVWVVRDVTNRTRSVFFQVISIFMVLFLTPLGIFLYLLLRPHKTLFEQIFEEEFFRIENEIKDKENQTQSAPEHQKKHTTV